MNKLNFNSLKNISVPETWIEKAINIPAQGKKKPLSFLKLSRIISVAACLVLVCTISLSTFFFTKNNESIIVGVKTTTSDATNQNRYTQATYNTEISESKKLSYYSESKEQNSETVQNSIKNSTEKVVETVNGELVENSTIIPTEKSEEPNSVETSSSAETTVPTTSQIQQTSVSTEAKEPTANTDNISPSSSVTIPDNSGWAGVESLSDCYGAFPKNLVVDNGNIYCRIYDNKGKLLGDDNLFSSHHLVHTKQAIDSYLYVTYSPVEAGLKLDAGQYTFYFYNEKGEDVYKGVLMVS